MEFYSHVARDEAGNVTRQKQLKEHLGEVARQMKHSFANLPVTDTAALGEAAYMMGIAHDFGKFTTYFQKYLLYGQIKESLHFHGFISAVFAAYVMQMLKPENEVYGPYLPLISYFFVLHHHGNLGSLEDDVIPKSLLKGNSYAEDKRWAGKMKTFQRQLEDIKPNAAIIEAQYKELGLDLSIADFMVQWPEVLKSVDLQRYKLLNKENEETRIKVLITGLMLYSALIDNDKMDAAQVSAAERKSLADNLVDAYRMERFGVTTKPLDKMRNSIYNSVTAKIGTVPLTQHLFTITAPTGSGKTLTGLSAALKLKKRIEDNMGYSPRIIYSLPFTSIIDQNYGVIKEVLGQIDDFSDNENLYLIKHHHLSELSYTREGVEEPLDKALMLIESWQAEIIVTTFIQLFYTIIGYRNKFLKKYHNIAGSVIILDEVQNIGVEYWPLISRVINAMAEQLNCYIILMTATKPLIFDEGKSIELVENHEQYFKSLNRVSLIPETMPMTVEDMAGHFMDIYDDDLSYLVVMNTIKSSIEFYNLIKERVNAPLFYLSTNIIPRDRAKRIKEIKEYTDNHEPVVVVSTQVVEAGVDIDMDIVMRDIGPIDSIVQVAGRCKRNSIDDEGKVYVYRLVEKKDEDKEGRLLAKRIYGSIHCMLALKMLEQGTVAEREFYDMINKYFSDLEASESQQISEEILQAMEYFRFSRDDNNIPTVASFSLIDEQPDYVDVFVEIDDEARTVWDEYATTVLAEQNETKKREARLKIKNKVNSYIISVPGKIAMGLQPKGGETKVFLKLPLEGLDLFYDEETGFKRSRDMDVWMA